MCSISKVFFRPHVFTIFYIFPLPPQEPFDTAAGASPLLTPDSVKVRLMSCDYCVPLSWLQSQLASI